MKKVFIARDLSGACFIYDEKPTYSIKSYHRSCGNRELLSGSMIKLLGLPYPNPGEMIEWPPTAQTAAPEPWSPAETLAPITSISQLSVGDMVRNSTGNGQKVLALAGELVALPVDGQPGTFDTWWTMTELKEWGYQQVVTAPRTLSREEARKAMDEGKTVRRVDGDVWYCLSGEKMHIRSGRVTDMRLRWYANINAFDVPEGRYEIIGDE